MTEPTSIRAPRRDRRLPQLAHVACGPPDADWITFIPGIGNDRGFWRPQADGLAARYRCLRFDPWGCGDSEPPPSALTIEVVVAGIVQLWDRLGVGSSSVVGLGFGGSTALLAALRHPSRVTAVVACCCRPQQPESRRQFWRERAATVERDGLASVADAVVSRWLRPDLRESRPEVACELRAELLRYSAEGYARYARAFADMDLTRDIDSLSVPTLLVAAEHDHGGGPVPDMSALHDQIPSSEFTVVADSGHIANWEAPARVDELLAGFLGRVAQR